MEDFRSRLERFAEDQDLSYSQAELDDRIDSLTELRERTRPPDVDADVAVFSVLANETRYELLRLFAGSSRQLCVCEFTPLFDVSESMVSQALGDLVDVDLVAREKRGRWRFYEATERGQRLVELADELLH